MINGNWGDAPRVPSCAPTLLAVFSATDQLWPEQTTTDEVAAMSSAVRFLTSREIPLIWISHRSAADVLRVQGDFGFCHPFICDAGAYLYMPRAYFGELSPRGKVADAWNVLEFTTHRDAGHAVRLLASLFRSCQPELIIVGLAQEASHGVVLDQVDVPIVVRSSDHDQTGLLQWFPTAYVTNAVGVEGWREAVLGPAAE